MEEPLYVRISRSLRRSIIRGEYRPDDVLPSENELAQMYSTSRVTVRKSLDVLESEGLIKPVHGKGYFVLPPKHTTFTLYFGDSVEKGRFRFLEVNLVHPERDVSEKLRLRRGQMAIVMRRVLESCGRRIAYDEKFVPYERGVPSVEFEISYAEFPDMFEKRFAPMSLRTEMEIGVEAAPEHVCRALGVAFPEKLLVVSRLIISSDGQPLGYGKQYLSEEYGRLKAKSGYYSPEKP